MNTFKVTGYVRAQGLLEYKGISLKLSWEKSLVDVTRQNGSLRKVLEELLRWDNLNWYRFEAEALDEALGRDAVRDSICPCVYICDEWRRKRWFRGKVKDNGYCRVLSFTLTKKIGSSLP